MGLFDMFSFRIVTGFWQPCITDWQQLPFLSQPASDMDGHGPRKHRTQALTSWFSIRRIAKQSMDPQTSLEKW